jgi:acyl-CoA synthetase (NDP forming)
MDARFVKAACDLCGAALAEGRDTLMESELYGLLAAGGVATPAFFSIPVSGGALGPVVGTIPGEKAVVKVESPAITHKTEAGGVRIVRNDPAEIEAAGRAILAAIRERGGDDLLASVRAILVCEFVKCPDSLGAHVFAGLRWTDDMGPVAAIGFGGLDAEELAARFGPGESTVLWSPVLTDPDRAMDKIRKSYAFRRITGRTREARRFADDAQIRGVVEFFTAIATQVSNAPGTGLIVKDFEINPFFATGERLVAVDAFLRCARGHVTLREAPVGQMESLLRPKTAAVMGVSNKGVNPGRIILRNLLREKFPTDAIRVIRPDGEAVDGVAGCTSISALPWVADLVVVAVGAREVPGILEESVATGNARSLVLIPGGMGETDEGKETDRLARDTFFGARAAGRPTPVLVGPNCLGLRSVPGRYDTLFIPEAKLPLPEAPTGNLALVCQSGAFMITRMNDLPFLAPRYAVSTGNQMDLALVDFVEALLRDDEVKVFALYIEGFNPLDGLRLARLIRQGRAAGRDFVVYKAGRTSEGRTATSSHTASISGDYPACAQVLADAGALVTSSFEEFNALLSMASLLRDKKVGGLRLGTVSNAGFETVGMADNVSESPKGALPVPSPATATRLRALLEEFRLGALVNVRNPIDITPMAPDKVYVEAARAFLDDPGMDGVVVGIVPLSPAMKTLPPGVDPTGRDSCLAPDSIPDLLPAVVAASDKPVVCTVDSGKLYDALANALRGHGIVCLRSVDTAMRCFQRYLAYRLGL